jgi:hypothetical protein
LAIANPKTYPAIAAGFGRTSILAEEHALDAALKTALLGVMIVVIHIYWLSASAPLSRVPHHPVSSRIVVVAMAAGLIITAVMAFQG